MEAKIVDILGSMEELEKVILSDSIFNVPMRADIIKRVIAWQLAKRRLGTRKTKGISEISGTTAKPHKQKGTGKARQGSLRSAQFRGGAIIFGPVVRDHSHSLQKKVRKLGLKVALSEKLRQNSVIFAPDLSMSEIKTSDLSKRISGQRQSDKERVLFIVSDDANSNFVKSARNIENVNVLNKNGLNVYDIVKNDKIIITKSVISYIEERLA